MTVIAAITTQTHTIIGSDIATDYSSTLISRAKSKIIKVTADNGELILFGGAGNAALTPYVTRHLQIEDTPDRNSTKDADAWAETIAESITTLAAEATPPLINDGSLDGCLLMAWRQHLWYVFAHHAIRPHDGIAAVGSGCEAARGSMNTAISHGVDAETAVRDAIRWACVIDTGCRVDERGPLLHETDRTI